MENNNFKTNLKALTEIILDEQRLVTYISVSKELCIHVNEAKFLLDKVIENVKMKQPTVVLNINYILSGISDDNSARTTVCSIEDLSKFRDSFKVVFFEHIYSVSQGLPMLDRVAFVSINKFDDFPLCTGLIKSNSCLKRTSTEIGLLKTNSQTVVDSKTNPTPKETKITIKNVPKTGHEDVTKLQETKMESKVKSEILSPKKNSTITKTIDKKNGGKTSKSIAGFFSKASSTPTIKTNNVSTAKASMQNVELIEVNKVQVKEELKIESMDVDEKVPVENGTQKSKVHSNTSNKSKPKSINQIKKNAKVDKKRKRVLHVSDSESDNEKNDPFADEIPNDQESEDEIPPTPLTNTVKITSGLMNPKKKRKIVDKTYTDEEGYILTKKVEVYESCSENEEEVHTKENVAVEVKENKIQIKTEVSPKEKKIKNSKKKISPPQKGKQATMMNFFKKV